MSGLLHALGIPGGPMMLFATALTLGAYLVGVALQRRTGWALLNPVLTAIVLIGLALRVLRIDYAVYFSGAQMIHFSLGPATVALAVPLVRAVKHIRVNLWPMMAGLLAGSMTSMVTGYGLTRLCGGGQTLALSMLAKSMTTPIAMDVAQTVGGIPSLTAVLAILAGILVAAGLESMLKWLRIAEPAAIGLGAGTAGSGIGAAVVLERHPLSGAFAAVAIGLNGLMTSAMAPGVARVLRHW